MAAADDGDNKWLRHSQLGLLPVHLTVCERGRGSEGVVG